MTAHCVNTERKKILLCLVTSRYVWGLIIRMLGFTSKKCKKSVCNVKNTEENKTTPKKPSFTM